MVVPVYVFTQPPKPFPAFLKSREYRFLGYRTNTAKMQQGRRPSKGFSFRQVYEYQPQ
jgi:hypothetical protein